METEVTLPPTTKIQCPRADIQFVDDGGETINLDVAIVAPTSKQAMQGGASSKLGAAAKQSAQAKRSKYDPFDITPLVLESGGRVGTDFTNFIRDLLPDGFSRSTMAQAVWQTVAATLQRANARAVLQARRAWRMAPAAAHT